MIKTMYEKENTRIEKIGKKATLIDETNEKITLMDQIINAGDKGSVPRCLSIFRKRDFGIMLG